MNISTILRGVLISGAAITFLLPLSTYAQEAEDDMMVCSTDVDECPDGSFVSRDPADNCNFEPCPSPPVTGTNKCQAGEGLWNLQLTTDNYGFETKWALYSAVDGDDNDIKVSGGPPTPYNYADNTNYIGNTCLPVGNYYMRWNDLFADGVCCDHGEGKWIVKVNGEVVLENDPTDDSFTQKDFPFMVVEES